jgi:hypothetical protein
VELCCLICSTEYTYLSSTIVKEVAGLHGDVSQWVAPVVAIALSEHFAANPLPGLPTDKVHTISKTRGKLSYRS